MNSRPDGPNRRPPFRSGPPPYRPDQRPPSEGPRPTYRDDQRPRFGTPRPPYREGNRSDRTRRGRIATAHRLIAPTPARSSAPLALIAMDRPLTAPTSARSSAGRVPIAMTNVRPIGKVPGPAATTSSLIATARRLIAPTTARSSAGLSHIANIATPRHRARWMNAAASGPTARRCASRADHAPAGSNAKPSSAANAPSGAANLPPAPVPARARAITRAESPTTVRLLRVRRSGPVPTTPGRRGKTGRPRTAKRRARSTAVMRGTARPARPLLNARRWSRTQRGR